MQVGGFKVYVREVPRSTPSQPFINTINPFEQQEEPWNLFCRVLILSDNSVKKGSGQHRSTPSPPFINIFEHLLRSMAVLPNQFQGLHVLRALRVEYTLVRKHLYSAELPTLTHGPWFQVPASSSSLLPSSLELSEKEVYERYIPARLGTRVRLCWGLEECMIPTGA